MARICDRSPCDGLMAALGKYIFGVRAAATAAVQYPKLEGFIVMVLIDGKGQEQEIEYCPFCGTRIEEVNAMVIDKFTRPRLRKRKTKYDYRAA